MKRAIIKIDEDKCTGCGLCVPGCVEGALQIVDGKAKLVSETYCDGLGACIGDCPEGALTIEEREAEEFDEKAVEEFLAAKNRKKEAGPVNQGCPGSALQSFLQEEAATPPPVSQGCPGSALRNFMDEQATDEYDGPEMKSRLGQWPVQLMLVPPTAPFLKNADMLVCADCVPFALPDFHERFLKGRAVVVACPKLDDLGHYREKLTAMLAEAEPKSVTVLRMEVPCCGGIAGAVVEARDRAMPELPINVHVIGIKGDVTSQVM